MPDDIATRNTRRHEKRESTQGSHEVLLYGQFGSAEVNQQAGSDRGRPQVAKNLSDVIIDDNSDGLQLNDQTIFDEQIGIVLAENCAVLVRDRERMLLQ